MMNGFDGLVYVGKLQSNTKFTHFYMQISIIYALSIWGKLTVNFRCELGLVSIQCKFTGQFGGHTYFSEP